MISDKANHENVKYNRKRESEKRRHSSYGKEKRKGEKERKGNDLACPLAIFSVALYVPLRTYTRQRRADRRTEKGRERET